MKICIVTPSFQGGGAERISVNLANFYAEQRYEVTVIAVLGEGHYRALLSDKVKIIDLKCSLRKALFPLRNSVKSISPDVVLSVIRSTSILLGIGLFLDKEKLIFREANTMNGTLSMPFIKRSIFKTLMRLSYSRASMIIANSQDTKNDLLRNEIIQSKKCKVIGNPVINDDIYQKSEVLLDHPWFSDPSKKVILNVGRFHEQKNQIILIQAFAEVRSKYKEARLVLLGEGELRDYLINLCKELLISDYVDFVSFKINPYPYYARADVFVLCSNWEGFGNVLVEAMSMRTPVISTDCPGGPRSILEGGRMGKLIPINDVGALSNALAQHFEGGINEEQISAAYSKAVEFSIKRIGSRYLQEMQ